MRFLAALFMLFQLITVPASAQQPLPPGWINATVAANGCAAVDTAAANNHPALQCMIEYLNNTYGAGRILLPPGWVHVCNPIVLKGGVTLQGVSKEGTLLAACGNHTTVLMDTSVHYGGFRDIFVVGYQNAAATMPAVQVLNNVPAIMRDCNIWGGNWGLMTSGVDGVVDNCYIMGSNAGGVWSNGANWYMRLKADTNEFRGVGFFQYDSFNGQMMENTFDQSDFSGPFNFSIYINASTAYTVCNSCVVSGTVLLEKAKATIFSGGSHFGSTILNYDGPVIISGASALTPISVVGAGPRSCAATYNIYC